MTRNYYTPEQKAAALQRLRENMGDLPLTGRQLAIPQRTLREWRQQYHAFKALQPTSSAVSAVSAASEPVDPPPPSTINPPPPLCPNLSSYALS